MSGEESWQQGDQVKGNCRPRLEMHQGESAGTETRKVMGKRLRRTTDVLTKSCGAISWSRGPKGRESGVGQSLNQKPRRWYTHVPCATPGPKGII